MAGSSLVGLLVPAGLLSLAIFMHILACALFNNWWPMLSILLYVLMLLPAGLLLRDSESLFEPGSAAGKQWSVWLLSSLVTFVIGLPIVLCHVEVIETGAVWLDLSGFVLLIATVAAAALLGSVGGES